MRTLWLTLISACGLQLAAFSQTTPIHRGTLLSDLNGNEKSITNVNLSASDLTRGTVGSAVLTGSNAYNGSFTGDGGGLTNLPAVWGGLSNTAASGTNVIVANAWTTIQNGDANTLVVTNGRVGLGTTVPQHTLDVSGKIALNGTVIAYRPTNLEGSLILGDGGTALSHVSDAEGYYNTFVGIGSGTANTTGGDNTAIGYAALTRNTTGGGNTANGRDALTANTTGSYNTANGMYALAANRTGGYNTANGFSALTENTTGSGNTANGMYALAANKTGSYNTANGMYALSGNTTGGENTVNGYYALTANTTGSRNTANGFCALYANTTGGRNSALGYFALYDLNILDGEGNNTAIGYNTGRGLVTGTNNTILGANVTGLSASLANNIIIADGSGNQRINVDSVGNVGLGTATPTALLTVNGTASFSNDVAIVGASSDLTIAGTVIGNTTITASTGFLLPTNYSAAAFVPTTAMGTLVISNAVLYFVTNTQTNLISDGR